MRQGVFEVYDVFAGTANHAAKQGVIDGQATQLLGTQDVVVIEPAEDRRAAAIGAPVVILILADG